MTLVWEMASPELAQMETVRLATMMRSTQSWMWVDPGLETGAPHGWHLRFHVEQQDAFVVLTLVPDPEGPEE